MDEQGIGENKKKKLGKHYNKELQVEPPKPA
jgi:hypothetical protein